MFSDEEIIQLQSAKTAWNRMLALGRGGGITPEARAVAEVEARDALDTIRGILAVHPEMHADPRIARDMAIMDRLY